MVHNRSDYMYNLQSQVAVEHFFLRLVESLLVNKYIFFTIKAKSSSLTELIKLIADVMANAVIEGKQGESFEPVAEQDVTEEAENNFLLNLKRFQALIHVVTIDIYIII